MDLVSKCGTGTGLRRKNSPRGSTANDGRGTTRHTYLTVNICVFVVKLDGRSVYIRYLLITGGVVNLKKKMVR